MTERIYDYDLAVIGGGPGGYVAAIRGAKKGLKTVIIEKESFGGTCLNVGCIPTKTLVKTVNVLDTVKRAADFAVDTDGVGNAAISMSKLQERKKAIIAQLTGGVVMLLKGSGADIIQAEGKFVDRHTIMAGDKKITSKDVIIATGSETLIPSFIGYSAENNVITSTEALNIDYVPESLGIIGGGVVGIEFAYIFSQLGTKVTVFELMDRILPMVDNEISGKVQRILKKEGVNFITGARVRKINGNTVVYEKEGSENSVESDLTLMAVGRKPNLKGFGIEELGIDYSEKGIRVDEHLRTSAENIYAIGDVNGKSMLAHTASHEGIVAVENILGENSKMRYDAIPACIYINPEIASVGLTEEEARQRYGSIRVGKFPMMANGKSLIEGETNGLIKVILSDADDILGVHIFAEHATDMIGQISVAMNSRLKGHDIINSILPHPTVSEAIGEAFMSCYGEAIHYS